MQETFILCAIIIGVGLIFDFINGFHDAASSVSTLVGSKLMTQKQAVAWVSFFNFLAIFLFGSAVAQTMGSGLIDVSYITPIIVLCGLLGAIGWNFTTWYFSIPCSSSHALLGGYAGAALMHHALNVGFNGAAFDVLILSGWVKIIALIIIAPAVGGSIAAFLIYCVQRARWLNKLSTNENGVKKLQLATSAFLNLMHGSNDIQKTAGIMTSALVLAGLHHSATPPLWLVLVCFATIQCGVLFGGKRIVQTVATKLTTIKNLNACSADIGTACAIMLGTVLGLPASTTQSATGAIIGSSLGTGQKVEWSLAHSILVTWLLTIPCAASFGALLTLIIAP